MTLKPRTFRAFQVAKELNLDAREFFELAMWAGVVLHKKSMLVRITEKQRETLIEFHQLMERWNSDGDSED